MASGTVTAGDVVAELRRLFTACLGALDAGDLRLARELADQADSLAANVGVLAAANAALIAGMVDRAAGDDATALHMFARAADLAGRHLAAADGIRLYLQASLELAVLHRVRGDYSQAEQLLLDALATSMSGWPEPRDLARLYNELGVVSVGLGDFRQATNSYRCARNILESVVPEETSELASVYRNIGALARARGDQQGAEEGVRRAVALRERALGPKHPDVAGDRAVLALVLLDLGQLDEAERLLREAVPVLEQAPGGPHPDHAMALGHLAAVAHRRGHHYAAAILYHRLVCGLEQAAGRDDRGLASALSGLAALYRSLDAAARAAALDARASAILDRTRPSRLRRVEQDRTAQESQNALRCGA